MCRSGERVRPLCVEPLTDGIHYLFQPYNLQHMDRMAYLLDALKVCV